MTSEELEKIVDLVGLKTLVLSNISADDLLNNPYRVVFKDDHIEFYNENNKLDSYNDLPAIIFADGTKLWHKNGELHRDGDKPTAIWADGTKLWYKNGLRHRDGDMPAVILADGAKVWYKNGLRHRDGDKPTVIWADGERWWYKNEKLIKKEKSQNNINEIRNLIRLIIKKNLF